MNGDGRLDVVDASEQPGRWTVYLNTPGGPSGVKWVRRSISIKNLEAELVSRGYVFPDHHIPLSRRVTGVTANGTFCIHRSSSTQPFTPYQGEIKNLDGTVIAHCNDQGVPDTAPPPICIQPGVCRPNDGIEKSFVEWDLLDVNGDGYPDMVYNSLPADFFVSPGVGGVSFDDGKAGLGTPATIFDCRTPQPYALRSTSWAFTWIQTRTPRAHLPDRSL
jgi:hypothetical protein